MNLESIKETSFGKFQSNTFENLNMVTGGRYQKTGAGQANGVSYCCDIKDDEGKKDTIYYGGTIKA